MSEASDIRQLARQILGAKQDRVQLLMGEVAASPGGGVVDVYLQGEEEATPAIPYLASYTPAVSDVVWLIKHGPVMFVLGELA